MTSPFSVRLSAILKSHGMSQTDLAAASGLSPAAISRYASGKRIPSIEVSERISAAFGVGPEVLRIPFLHSPRISLQTSAARTPVSKLIRPLARKPPATIEWE